MTLNLWTVIDEQWPKGNALLLEWDGDEYPRLGERRVVNLWRRDVAVYVDGFRGENQATATYWVRRDVPS